MRRRTRNSRRWERVHGWRRTRAVASVEVDRGLASVASSLSFGCSQSVCCFSSAVSGVPRSLPDVLPLILQARDKCKKKKIHTCQRAPNKSATPVLAQLTG